MTRLPIALAAASLALLLPSSALGAAGVANGVHVRTVAGGVVVYFGQHADHAFADVRGRQLRVSCTAYSPQGSLTPTAESVTVSQPTSRNLRLIRVGLGPQVDWDICEVGRAGSSRVTKVGLTASGRARIDEERLGRKLLYGFTFASDRSVDGLSMPSTAWVVAAPGSNLVALADADATPPAGTVGYFSDNPRHAVVATRSAAGRRLFFELDDDVLSSNVWEYLNP
jgi:hypothetical protein